MRYFTNLFSIEMLPENGKFSIEQIDEKEAAEKLMTCDALSFNALGQIQDDARMALAAFYRLPVKNEGARLKLKPGDELIAQYTASAWVKIIVL